MLDEKVETTEPSVGPANQEGAVEIKGARKVYGSGESEKVALQGVDLRVPVGSIYGLLGPNGAGKSTLINILAGLTRKTAGSVRIWGFDQDVNPRMARASIGVVHQELHIDPFLTPGEAMEIQAGLYGVPKERRRTSEILAALGLADKEKAYARTLSGGMRRRLMVAKAMVHDPAVLVLDEPTAGVDIELRRQLWAYVAELNKAGVTVILTTHYLEEAEEMCDRIAILNQGEIVAEAPTPELLERIDRRVVRVRPAGEVDLEKVRAAAPEGVSASRREDGWLALGYARRQVQFGALLAGLAAAKVEIADLCTEDADLEDVFLELTKD